MSPELALAGKLAFGGHFEAVKCFVSFALVAIVACGGPDISDHRVDASSEFDAGAPRDGGADASADASMVECAGSRVEFIPSVEGTSLVAGETYCDLLRVCVANEQTASELVAAAAEWQCAEAPNGGPPSACRSPEFICSIEAPATIDDEYDDVCAATLLPGIEPVVCTTFVGVL